MEDKFKIGHTVVLKSGGPAMVIYDIEEESIPAPDDPDHIIVIGTNVKCHWLPDGGTELASISVPETSLELWDDVVE